MITSSFTKPSEHLNDRVVQVMREALLILDASDCVIGANEYAGNLFGMCTFVSREIDNAYEGTGQKFNA